MPINICASMPDADGGPGLHLQRLKMVVEEIIEKGGVRFLEK
jgi:hypothetical protein